jgi:putative membrane protein
MSMNMNLRPTAALLALLFSVGTAVAQSSGTAGGSGATAGAGTSATGGGAAPKAQPGTGTRNAESNKDDKLASADRKFVLEAAGSGMFEVQAGQLAASKATDPQVKSFASMLVEHHSAANNELTQLANTKGVELPAAPPRAMRSEIDKLGKKTGQEFDRDFVRNVGIKAHQKDVKLFEKASKDLKDPQLKAFAAKTLPTLQQHLAQAQKLPQAGGKGGGNDAASMGNTGGGASTRTGGGTGANKTGS